MKHLLPGIFVLMIAIAAVAQDTNIPTHDIYCDVAAPQREFAVRSASGSTPTVRAYLLHDGDSWLGMIPTNEWGGVAYYYGESWHATNYVDVTSSANGTNWIDFAFAVTDTATNGTFIMQIVITNATKVYRFGPGALTLDYVPPLLYGGVGLDLGLNGVEDDPIFAASNSALFHNDVAGEIQAVAVKGTPVAADVVLIEDSAASGAKKRVALSTLDRLTLFPLFHLEMGAYTDFEIKASTNNFATEDHVFFIQSWQATSPAGMDDNDVDVYFTDSASADPRVWRKATIQSAISGQVADGVHSLVDIVLMTSRAGAENAAVADVVVPATNDLVWSWVRYDGAAYEQDGAANPFFRPLTPTEWRAQRIEP